MQMWCKWSVKLSFYRNQTKVHLYNVIFHRVWINYFISIVMF